MFASLVFMSVLLGVCSFGFGMLPLSFVFSKPQLARLSSLGTGLLLGAALGVIIPEGIETVASNHPSSGLPTSEIALSLLLGFTFMLIIEQLVSPHSHLHSQALPLQSVKEQQPHGTSEAELFDAELGQLEREHDVGRSGFVQVDIPDPLDLEESRGGKELAYPLTFGLVIHGLADGLALGVSSLQSPESGALSNLSLIVFLALIIHKAPTALALTTSLLATTLPRLECKKHLVLFSATTPFGAVMSYTLFSFLGAGSEGRWTGVALLFSGGTFLYVATVLQPVSHHSSSPAKDEMRETTRVLCITVGMFVPFLTSAILGHH